MSKPFIPSSYMLSPEELPLMKRALRAACELRPSEGTAAVRLAGRDLIEVTEKGLIVLTERGRAALAHHKARNAAIEALERPRRAALIGAVALRRPEAAPPRINSKTPKTNALREAVEPSLQDLLSITTYDRKITAQRSATLHYRYASAISENARRHWVKEATDPNE